MPHLRDGLIAANRGAGRSFEAYCERSVDALHYQDVFALPPLRWVELLAKSCAFVRIPSFYGFSATPKARILLGLWSRLGRLFVAPSGFGSCAPLHNCIFFANRRVETESMQSGHPHPGQ
jgi:hypothetical protein